MIKDTRHRARARGAWILSGAALVTTGCADAPPSDTQRSDAHEYATDATQLSSIESAVVSTTACSVSSSASSAPFGGTATTSQVVLQAPSRFTVPATLPFTGPGVFSIAEKSQVYLKFRGPLAPVTCTYAASLGGNVLQLASCTGSVASGSTQTAQTFELTYDSKGTWPGTVATLTLNLNVAPSAVCRDSCADTGTCQSGATPACVSSSHAACAPTAAPSGLSVKNVANGGYIAGPAPANTPLRLRGANYTGPELACYGGVIAGAGKPAGQAYPPEGIFDGPATLTESVSEMKAWGINAVRIPLNQDCWLKNSPGLNSYSGAFYQNAIKQAVALFESNGMTVILDLHRSAPGVLPAQSQAPMADADHSATFWTQVTQAYLSDRSVIFDLFNEPIIIDAKFNSANGLSPLPSTNDWACWRAGSKGVKNTAGTNFCATAKGLSYPPDTTKPFPVAGMSSLLKAVRDLDKTRVVIMGGLYYATYFDQWVDAVADMVALDGLPADYIKNVGASWHQYDNKHDSNCPDENNGGPYASKCHPTAQETVDAAYLSPVRQAGYPVIIGEVGMHPYNTGSSLTPFKSPDGGVDVSSSSSKILDIKNWFNTLLTYADDRKIGYLAWSWSTSRGPWLLANGATPGTYVPGYGFGQAYYEHLASQPVCCSP